MALKSCPRCFREIPEESKICPHCHTEVKKCPKCETLAIKDTKICSRCGTPLPQSSILIENPEVSANLVVDHVKEFKRKNAFLSILSNQILWSTIAMGLMLVGGILFIFSSDKIHEVHSLYLLDLFNILYHKWCKNSIFYTKTRGRNLIFM